MGIVIVICTYNLNICAITFVKTYVILCLKNIQLIKNIAFEEICENENNQKHENTNNTNEITIVKKIVTKRMERVGQMIQSGSCLGSLLFFVLVNYTYLFQ